MLHSPPMSPVINEDALTEIEVTVGKELIDLCQRELLNQDFPLPANEVSDVSSSEAHGSHGPANPSRTTQPSYGVLEVTDASGNSAQAVSAAPSSMANRLPMESSDLDEAMATTAGVSVDVCAPAAKCALAPEPDVAPVKSAPGKTGIPNANNHKVSKGVAKTTINNASRGVAKTTINKVSKGVAKTTINKASKGVAKTTINKASRGVAKTTINKASKRVAKVSNRKVLKSEAARAKSAKAQSAEPTEARKEAAKLIREVYYPKFFNEFAEQYWYLHRFIIVLILAAYGKLPKLQRLLPSGKLVEFCTADRTPCEEPSPNETFKDAQFRFSRKYTKDIGILWSLFKGNTTESFATVTDAIKSCLRAWNENSEKAAFQPVSADLRRKPKLLYRLGPLGIKDLNTAWQYSAR